MNEALETPQKTCPNCGEVLENDPPFCPRCGASLLPSSAMSGVGAGSTCLGIFLLCVALLLGAFGGCLAVFSKATFGSNTNGYFIAGILLVAALAFYGAIKSFRK